MVSALSTPGLPVRAIAAGFFVEHDFWTPDQLDSNPIYRDFFRPHGLGWSAGTGLQMPTGDHIVFSIERDHSRGPIEKERVEALNELALPSGAQRLRVGTARPAARQGRQRGADRRWDCRRCCLDENGTVIEANRLIEDLGEHVQWRARNRIALTDGRANELLWAALAALGKRSRRGRALVSAARRRRQGVDGRSTCIPVRRSAHDIFSGSFALLVLTPVTAPPAPPVELMRSLFDLTPSEARVARGLAVGETLEEIASAGGVAITTVRSQLRQVLEKTGCARQAEVVSLLANVTLDRSAAKN